MNNKYDLIIIGAGPAGLSSGISAGRLKLRTLIIDKKKPGGQIESASEITNYPGIIKTSGEEIIKTMVKQAKDFGAEIITAKVVDVDFKDNIKVIKTTIGDFYSLGIIIATGTEYRKVGFKGEDEYRGRGVSYCSACDGEFFIGKEVFVIGSGQTAAKEAIFLTRYAKKVTIIAKDSRLTCFKTTEEKVLAHPNIVIKFNTEILLIEGEPLPRKAKFINNETGERWGYESNEDGFGIFVFIGCKPLTDIFDGKINLNQHGYINVDENLKTSVEGVYSTGKNLPKKPRLMTTAVADGAVAAIMVEKYIDNKKENLEISITKEVAPEQGKNLDYLVESIFNKKPSYEVEAESEKDIVKKFIDDRLASQLKPILSGFENPANILLIKNGESRMSREMEIFLKDIEKLGEKITLKIYDKSENRFAEEKISADRFPVIALFDGNKFSGVKYHTVPSGYEFNSFISGLYNLANPAAKIEKNVLDRIKSIEKKTRLQIGVSLSCEICPEVVQSAQIIAIHNKNISVEFIDVTEFLDFKNRYNIMSVPATVINENEIIFGKKTLDQLIDILLK